MSNPLTGIPRSDPALVDWAVRISGPIKNDPFRFGLTPSDAEVICTVTAQFIEAFDLVQSPATRTSGLIARKDALRASMLGTVRMYIRQIKANVGVSNSDKLAIGVHVDDPTRTSIGAPESRPVLQVSGTFNLRHEIRYRDSANPNVKRRPFGVTHLQLVSVITPFGEELPMNFNPDDAKLVGQFSRQPFTVHYLPEHAGATVTYWGRWITAKGLAGPWSVGFALMVAGAGAVVVPGTVKDEGARPMSLAA